MASIAALGIGSGLDLNGLLTQLESAERQRLEPLVQQRASYQARISAYGRLEGSLSAFQNALTNLGKPETFQAVSSSVTGEGLQAAASASAVPGSYNVQVNTLARAYSSATLGVDDKSRDLGAGTFSFNLGDGTSHSIDIEAGASSLEDIRDAINAQQGDVTASIINDGDPNAPFRLALTSSKTGVDAAVSSLTFNGFGDELAVDAGSIQAGTNASLTVNGVGISSQSNQVTDALQGITLTLEQEGQTATVNVTRDEAAITGAVENFVKSYNSLQSTIKDLSKYNAETQTAGRLLGDSGLRTVETRLRSIFSEAVDGEGLNTLSEIGISRQLNGSLELDTDKLKELTSTQLTQLSNFFTGTENVGTDEANGFVAKAGNTVTQLLDENGPIALGTEGMKSAIERLEERYAREEVSIARTIERYRVQFGQLDSMIANMNSTSSYLMQQFDALNAQLGNKK